jgi:hypothetical protein
VEWLFNAVVSVPLCETARDVMEEIDRLACLAYKRVHDDRAEEL